MVYFDEILVYNLSLEDCLVHLQLMLDVLRREKLNDNRKKCNFGMDQVVFWGMLCLPKECSWMKIRLRQLLTGLHLLLYMR